MSKATDKAASVNRLTVTAKHGESDAQAIARAAMQPTVQAAITAKQFLRGEFVDTPLDELAQELSAQSKAVQRGDLQRPEAILTAQAHTLDQIFNMLARSAYLNLWTNLDAGDRLLRLALKAQSQCRATLETLAAMKNPQPTLFARQANVTTGPQQVNNGVARAREIQTEQSKLLEQTHGERLDFGTASEAIGSDSAIAAVGAFDRTKDT